MSSNAEIERRIGNDYQAGFVTDIESDRAPKGLSEEVIRFISAKKQEPEEDK